VRKAFEILEHPADVGFVAYGATLEELFENAALAMMSLAGAVDAIEQREKREIRVTGDDIESLLFAWLAEFLAVADAEHLVFCRAEVAKVEAGGEGSGQFRVRGVALGESFDRARHRAGTYIKAVTFHQLRVEKTTDGWRGQVFLDV
jgi:SHS2 domain-containing protein